MLRWLITLPAGRWTKWMVLAVWLGVAFVIGPLAGKLTGAETNDAAAWLPVSAESTKVVKLQEKFASGDTLTAVVVYHRDSGTTTADRAAAERARTAVLQKYSAAGQAEPVQASTDGKALIFGVPLTTSESGDDLNKQVDDIRGIVGPAGAGLQVKVTGPAALLGDMTAAYGNLDRTIASVTVLVVGVLLLLTYRSLVLWLVPLLTVIFASEVSSGAAYELVRQFHLTVNSLTAGILIVLVYGAGTDYALLLISRYREELHNFANRHDAMRAALIGATPAVAASAGTIALGMLCLLTADLNTNRSLGPVAAVAVLCAFLAMITLLPAALVILGRWVFWPLTPRAGTPSRISHGLWSRVGQSISRRPRAVWLVTALVLGVMAVGMGGIKPTLSQIDQFRNTPDSVTGQRLLAASFPSGTADPAFVVARTGRTDAVVQAARNTPNVANVQVVGTSRDSQYTAMLVTLSAEPDSAKERSTLEELRHGVHAVPGADALVGGTSAQNLDLAKAANADNFVVMPLVLGVVLLVLILLLRALTAPLVLIVTVALSFGAALGASTFIFTNLFHFKGVDPSLPLQAFVFLVALGVDYNIFLATRVREETRLHGPREGVLRGLALTGGVITSAGLVLAATFLVLTLPPMVPLTELGFVVAFGILLDTLVVRSILVPALGLDLGRRMWWPSRLSRATTPSDSSAVRKIAGARS
jgi:RND superfamily putative drug exporter